MTSDELGPGQVYTREARKHTATLCQRELAVTIEPGGAPPAKGAWERDGGRAECPLRGAPRVWGPGPEKTTPSRSLANLERSTTETKWVEERQWRT
jgi:hypothetical protein